MLLPTHSTAVVLIRIMVYVCIHCVLVCDGAELEGEENQAELIHVVRSASTRWR